MKTIIRRDLPLANDHLKGSASCKWLSEGTGLLQMMISRERPLANDNPKGPPLANDHSKALASRNWSSQGIGPLQMIIQRDWPLANDHLKGPASCKWSSVGTETSDVWEEQPYFTIFEPSHGTIKSNSQCGATLEQNKQSHKRFALFTWSSLGKFWRWNQCVTMSPKVGCNTHSLLKVSDIIKDNKRALAAQLEGAPLEVGLGARHL